MKKGLFIAFGLGCLVTLLFYANIEMPLPEAFEIERNGKVVGYADTRPEWSEFVIVKKAKNPGLFIAFPIFGDQQEIQTALS